MRLICPNCGAQYEVDPSVIPEGGRDVQCSNCGHTWFQRHMQDADAETATEITAKDQTADETAPDPAADDRPLRQTDDEIAEKPAEAGREPSENDSAAPETPEAGPGHDQPAPQRQPLGEDVASILQEEAAREAAERGLGDAAEKADAALAGSESPESGLSGVAGAVAGTAAAAATGAVAAAAQQKDELSERIAALSEASEEPGADMSAETDAARKELLPDIEEINSTLAADSSAAIAETDDDFAPERKRGGFRRGFIIAVVLFILLALIYAFAPALADKFPAAAPALATYVEWVNALRAAVDSILLKAVDKITGLLTQMGGDKPG